jgi:hypothetical protein
MPADPRRRSVRVGDVAIRGHSLVSTLPDLSVLGGVSMLVAALTPRTFRWDA